MKPHEQMKKFFRQLDGLLGQSFDLTIIGGTAMVLGYGSERMTSDCDPWGRASQEIREKWGEARKLSGINLSLDTQAGVAQLPEGFEERLESLDQSYNNLKIFYPEKHDLALSKLTRLMGSDLDDILWLHTRHQLDSEVLVSRYMTELRPIYIGQVSVLDLNFLDVIEEVFGLKKRQEVAKLLQAQG